MLESLSRTFMLVSAVFCLAAALAPPEPPPRQSLLVLEPSSSVIDPATRGTLLSLIIVEVAGASRLDVLSPNDVKRLVELEGEKQTAGCLDNSSCLADLAGALGARYVVFGDLGPLGSQLVLNLNLFDSQHARAVSRVTARFTTLEELPGQLPNLVSKLLAPLAPEQQANYVGAEPQADREPVIEVKSEPPLLIADAAPLAGSPEVPHVETLPVSAAPEPATPPTPAISPAGEQEGPAREADAPQPPILGWGLVGGGSLLFAAGVAWDLLSPTSYDYRLRLGDAIGPAAAVAGIASVGIGALLVWSTTAPPAGVEDT